MVASFGSRLLPILLGSLLAATSLPDLFQKAKQEFRLASYASALSTLEQLDVESSKEGFEKDRQAVLPGLLFYKGACQAALGRSAEAEETFQAFLAIKPDIQLDPAVYPKKVITAFENARNAIQKGPADTTPPEAGAIALAYKAYVVPEGHSDESTREDWLEGPVRWLVTAEEKRTYSGLGDPVSRSEFIANFWKSRDRTLDTRENEFREEFERRVAFADNRFAQDEVRGALTDRGMVFILMGPPTYSGSKRLETGDDAADASGLSRYSHGEVQLVQRSGGGNSTTHMSRVEKVTGPETKIQDSAHNWIEAWHYLRSHLPREIPYLELEFDFVTKQGYGTNVLQRETNVLNALERAKALTRKS